jgi:deazaflavin-dependent oxidoreductase (nitroreductase family)
MSADAVSFNRRIVEEFRANEGRVGGEFEDAPLVLMTAIGAKSGQPRTTPHWCEDAGNGAVAIYASNNGHPEPPLWLANLAANPAVTVERGSNSYRAVARVTSGEERDRLWGQVVAANPTFGEYQVKAGRQIAVVVLEPVESGS